MERNASPPPCLLTFTEVAKRAAHGKCESLGEVSRCGPVESGLGTQQKQDTAPRFGRVLDDKGAHLCSIPSSHLFLMGDRGRRGTRHVSGLAESDGGGGGRDETFVNHPHKFPIHTCSPPGQTALLLELLLFPDALHYKEFRLRDQNTEMRLVFEACVRLPPRLNVCPQGVCGPYLLYAPLPFVQISCTQESEGDFCGPSIS